MTTHAPDRGPETDPVIRRAATKGSTDLLQDKRRLSSVIKTRNVLHTQLPRFDSEFYGRPFVFQARILYEVRMCWYAGVVVAERAEKKRESASHNQALLL